MTVTIVAVVINMEMIAVTSLIGMLWLKGDFKKIKTDKTVIVAMGIVGATIGLGWVFDPERSAEELGKYQEVVEKV